MTSDTKIYQPRLSSDMARTIYNLEGRENLHRVNAALDRSSCQTFWSDRLTLLRTFPGQILSRQVQTRNPASEIKEQEKNNKNKEGLQSAGP